MNFWNTLKACRTDNKAPCTKTRHFNCAHIRIFQKALTFDRHKYIIKTVKSEVIKLSPRTGRPTSNPKPYKITVRIDEESKTILETYCKQENVPQMEAVRRGIKKLESEIKK